MIRYFIDKEQKYKDELLVHLRAHNYSHTNDKTKESKCIYAYRDNQLVGAITASYSWAWVGVGDFYYQDLDVLKALIAEVVKLYRDRVVGFKMFSKVKEEISDFREVGFKEVGRVPDIENFRNGVYLDLDDFDIQSNQVYNIDVVEDAKEDHKEFMQHHLDEYRKRYDLERVEDILYVAVEDETFCGGIHFEVYNELIHTHLLAVNKEYRGHQIGTKLMNYVESYAKERGYKILTVGTTEFQARPFYEKLGYKVVYTRQDHPKGYECYTLYKELEE